MDIVCNLKIEHNLYVCMCVEDINVTERSNFYQFLSMFRLAEKQYPASK